VYAFLYGAVNLRFWQNCCTKVPEVFRVQTGFRVYAFLYAVAATWGCFLLTAVSQRYFVSGRIASYLLHYSELAQNEEFSGFRWCVCQDEPLICQGHTGGHN
jgi:hypothetical protein